MSNRSRISKSDQARTIKNRRRPDFLLVGAQKSGTTWLWDMLDQHPGTVLPRRKEYHYFGSSELYAKGPEWYYKNFEDIDLQAVTGEASTSYLFDRIPYWYNKSSEISYDTSLPALPALVASELPQVRIIAVLRDPVRRAISAYFHWMKQGKLSPALGLRRTALAHPRLRILEYGDYARHLSAWMREFSKNQLLVLIFEEDVIGNPDNGLKKVYQFLGLEPEFAPSDMQKRVYQSWSWTRILATYYAGPFRQVLRKRLIGEFLNKYDFLGKLAIRDSDLGFLRKRYLPSHGAIENLIERSLDCWDYGQSDSLNSSLRKIDARTIS